jgi:hypothetical protein
MDLIGPHKRQTLSSLNVRPLWAGITRLQSRATPKADFPRKASEVAESPGRHSCIY